MVGDWWSIFGYVHTLSVVKRVATVSYVLLVVTVLSTSFMGMALLNFTMDKPHKQLLLQIPQSLSADWLKPRYLRILGWILLAVALGLSINVWGFSIGSAAYFGLLTLVVGMLIFLFSYRITWVFHWVLCAAVLNVLCAVALNIQ